MKQWKVLSACAIAALAVGFSAYGDEDEGIALDKTPAAVQASIKKVVGDGKLGEIKKENEDGKTIYEVEFVKNNNEQSATIAEDGKVVEEEEEVAVKDLPAAVSSAVKGKHADGKITKAEKVTADGKTFYEVEVKSGDTEYELKVDAAGSVMSDKKEDEDKKDEKDEKDEKNEKK